jgi:hypothetical protein
VTEGERRFDRRWARNTEEGNTGREDDFMRTRIPRLGPSSGALFVSDTRIYVNTRARKRSMHQRRRLGETQKWRRHSTSKLGPASD